MVDVGSNSVRLVTYRLEGRAIWTVYNEKVLAGLGRDLASTGKLSVTGVEQAVSALRRFKAVIDGAAPDEVLVAATAAVREAKDGQAFVERLWQELPLDMGTQYRPGARARVRIQSSVTSTNPVRAGSRRSVRSA